VELLSSCKPVEPFSLNKKKTTSCVQLPTYAENVPLPVFAAARRAAAPCCCGADRAAIDRYLLPVWLTAANPPYAAAADEWDRQTDGRTDAVPFHRLVPHTMRAVPITTRTTLQ